jgi:hypothetical protein
MNGVESRRSKGQDSLKFRPSAIGGQNYGESRFFGEPGKVC